MGVTVVLLADPRELRGASEANFRRFDELGGRWRRFTEGRLDRELARADVVVDAIFGTGFRGEPEETHRSAIEAMNRAPVPVVAVDIPSGVEGETGAIRGAAVNADVTLTFGALKPGLVFFPGARAAGLVHVVDIGFPLDLVRSDLLLVEEEDVVELLPHRQPESHKRSAGYVIVLAGSRAMTGAAILAARSAYRAGAGLVTMAIPEGILRVVEGAVTEATFLPLPETDDGSVSEAAWPILAERLQDAGAAAVGPGLTANPSTAALVRRLVGESPVPMVIDADGLNAYAGRASQLADRRSEAVLTPHAGEFARLTGIPAKDVTLDRVGHARKAAAEFRCPVLLKGSRTVVAEPAGAVRVTPTGGPYLATGGTGDVLTGAVAAFLAQGLAPADAAVVAAYVHGVAGGVAFDRLGNGVMATDVLDQLPEVLAVLGSD
jgi:NAD(P)H-hydrate epimerase